jgi:hypothetical protein
MAAQSVQRTTADEPDQTGCHEGPTIHFDRPPCRNPAPHLIGFPLWAACHSQCHACYPAIGLALRVHQRVAIDIHCGRDVGVPHQLQLHP